MAFDNKFTLGGATAANQYEGGYDEEGKPAEDVQGIQCCPCFTKAEWQEVHGSSVTMQSYLMCKCGGMVYPLSSGIEYED